MPDSVFLETYPLYRKFKGNFEPPLTSLPKPAVHMKCEECKSGQTFTMKNEYNEDISKHENFAMGHVIRTRYVCSSCRSFERHFLLFFSTDGSYVIKAGQYPAWEITPDPVVERMLGDYADSYKKGLVCESQSYGIGAFAYYRRIVEQTIDHLLEEILELMSGQEHEQYAQALEKVKGTNIAQDKIKLVKDLLPPILRPGEMNPLAVLHSVLSEGIHLATDERCLDLAVSVREVLTFLVSQISVTKSTSKNFTESMRKLLERKKDKSESSSQE